MPILTQIQPLPSLDDRITIARVISWDIDTTIHPEQILGIWMEQDIAWIQLDTGLVPIHREAFKTILAAQQELEAKGIQRENIETRTHCNQPLTLVPIQNIPHAYEVFYLGQPLGYSYLSPQLGAWTNNKCRSSFVDPFDAAERLFNDWEVEQGCEIALPY